MPLFPSRPALLLAVLACGTGGEGARIDAEAGGAEATPVDPWEVRLDGIGPLLYGMLVADARAALGDTLGDPTPTDKCVYLRGSRCGPISTTQPATI